MASKICRALVELCILSSILTVVFTAPIAVPNNFVTAHGDAALTARGLSNRKFHRPAFAVRRHAAHMVKRGAQWTVHAGETGESIAAQLGIQFSELALLNPTVQWSLLQVGSSLNIPSCDSSASHTYAVLAGDTGNFIAASNGITFTQLSACNQNVNWYNLQVGQNLLVPASSPSTSQASAILSMQQVEQDANSTASQTAIPTVPVIDVSTAAAPGTKSISPFLTPGETSSPPSLSLSHTLKDRLTPEKRGLIQRASVSISTDTTYIVKAGDTGYGIAMQLGISFDVLSRANPGVNWSNLQIGQSLKTSISAGSTATTIRPIPQETYAPQSSTTASPPISQPTVGAYVTYSGAVTAAQPPYPLMSKWIPFAQLWTMNSANIGTTCVFASGTVPPNTVSETKSLRLAILSVSAATHVDPSFILAVMLQESNGCVRAPTTSSFEGISNPGLMQSFNGRASCNSKGRMQQPCPDYLIKAMITEGVKGVRNVGIVPALSLAAKQDGTRWSTAGSANVSAQTNATGGSAPAVKSINQAMLYYQAARIYNSGSLSADGDLSSPTKSTRCYVSDVVNRLLGWTGAGKSCSLT